jgi:hypothetical protein|uniref:Uncharacterized protein n=1 Tax=Siphoviridae sp. ctqPo10 TaxID=2827948 RepID=A0A8S5SW67_9CAUD|nr:MAG TPA: hypothetical protein [Siphoviridae sp. ctqPo10]
MEKVIGTYRIFFSVNGRKSPYKCGDMWLKRINNYLLREQISFIIRRNMMGGD